IRFTYRVTCLVGCDRDGGAQLADRSPGLAWLVHPVLTWTRAQPGDDLLRCDGATWHHGEHPAAGDRLLYVRLWHCTGAVRSDLPGRSRNDQHRPARCDAAVH